MNHSNTFVLVFIRRCKCNSALRKNMHTDTGHIGIRWWTRIPSRIGQIRFLYQQMRDGDVGLFRNHRHTTACRIEIDHIVMVEPEYVCRRLGTVFYRTCYVDHTASVHINFGRTPNDRMWHCAENRERKWQRESDSQSKCTYRLLLNCRTVCAPVVWIFGIHNRLRHASMSILIRAYIRPANDCTWLRNVDRMCTCSHLRSVCEYLDVSPMISANTITFNHMHASYSSSICCHQLTVLFPKFRTLHLNWTDRPTTPINVTLFVTTVVVLPKSKYGSVDCCNASSSMGNASSCQLIAINAKRIDKIKIEIDESLDDKNKSIFTRINDNDPMRVYESTSCAHH